MSERELVQHIVGLPDKYEAIMIALSTNRGIAFVDLRQTLLNFEKKEQDRKSKFRTYRIQDKNKPRPKSCFICSKTRHLQKDCWFAKNNKRKNSGKPCTGMKRPNYKNKHTRISKERSTLDKESALSANETLIIEENMNEWHLESACTSHMAPSETGATLK